MNIRPDLRLIEVVSAQLTELLGDDFDPAAFWDTLDGETDVLDVADHLIGRMMDDEALAEAIAAQESALSARKMRVRARAETVRAVLLTVLDATGQKKLERPRATISRRTGSVSVRITDDASIPSQLCTVKTITSPDKAAIKKQIDAGEIVPGAELVRGPDGLTVRVK